MICCFNLTIGQWYVFVLFLDISRAVISCFNLTIDQWYVLKCFCFVLFLDISRAVICCFNLTIGQWYVMKCRCCFFRSKQGSSSGAHSHGLLSQQAQSPQQNNMQNLSPNAADPQVAGEFTAYHYPTAKQVSGSRSPGGWWVHCLPLSYSWTGLWLMIPRWLVSSLLTIILQLNRSLCHDPQVAGEFTAYHYPTAKQVSGSRSPGGWWVHCLPLSYSWTGLCLTIPRWLVSSLLTIILQLNRSLSHDPQVAGEFTAYHYPTAEQVSVSRSPGGWWVHCLPLSYS